MNDKKLLTVEELAEFLNVKRSWIYDKVYQGQLPHYKLGALLRFDAEEIKLWLKSNKRGDDPQFGYQMQPKDGEIDQER